MHATDGYGIAAEVHDELAVTVYADYVALLAGEEAGEDTETDVILGELDERVAEEGDALGGLLHDGHERAHDAVGDGGGEAGGAVVDQVVLGEVLHQESLELAGGTLEEDQAAD